MAKTVRIDNWGAFLLHKLQQLYDKGEFCDTILRFADGKELKVHYLILALCSTQLSKLESQGNDGEQEILAVPPNISYEIMEPVIRFMYTGKLEIAEGTIDKYSELAKDLEISVIAKLLEPQTSSAKLETAPANSPLTKTMRPLVKSSPALATKAMTVKQRASSKGPTRTANPFDYSPSSSRLDAGPTRYEFPGSESVEFGAEPTFSELLSDHPSSLVAMGTSNANFRSSLPHTPRIYTVSKANKRPRAEEIFDAIKKTVKPVVPLPSKASTTASAASEASQDDDLDSMKEFIKEQHRRKTMMASTDESEVYEVDTITADEHYDDWPDEEEETEANLSRKSILKSEAKESHELASNTSLDTPAAKKVRFSLDGGGTEISVETHSEPVAEEATVTLTAGEGQIVLEEDVSDLVSLNSEAAAVNIGGTGSTHLGNLTSHASIIAEVLRKYPHLVADAKNVRLKIVQKTSPGPGKGPSKSKVSYVVLKSNEDDDATALGSHLNGGDGRGLSGDVDKRSLFENIHGPWTCPDCVTEANAIVRFKTYYEYRQHFVKLHNLLADSRLCEYCGHRAVKRNHMLFHLYTVHGIPPPKHVTFPECDQCDYVALTSAIMKKHLKNHQDADGKGFLCKTCQISFPSLQELQTHLQETKHSRSHKWYICAVCSREFARNMNLKTHIRLCHKDYARKLDEEGWPARLGPNTAYPEVSTLQDVSEVEEVSEIDAELLQEEVQWTVGTEEEGGTVVLVTGLADGVTMVPSSEADALSHLSNSIAASLGLAAVEVGHAQGIQLVTEEEHQEQVEAVEGHTIQLVEYQPQEGEFQGVYQEVEGMELGEGEAQHGEDEMIFEAELTNEQSTEAIHATENGGMPEEDGEEMPTEEAEAMPVEEAEGMPAEEVEGVENMPETEAGDVESVPATEAGDVEGVESVPATEAGEVEGVEGIAAPETEDVEGLPDTGIKGAIETVEYVANDEDTPESRKEELTDTLVEIEQPEQEEITTEETS